MLILRAEMSNQKQNVITHKFNNSDEHINVLVVIYATCSVELNLHLPGEMDVWIDRAPRRPSIRLREKEIKVSSELILNGFVCSVSLIC